MIKIDAYLTPIIHRKRRQTPFVALGDFIGIFMTNVQNTYEKATKGDFGFVALGDRSIFYLIFR